MRTRSERRQIGRSKLMKRWNVLKNGYLYKQDIIYNGDKRDFGNYYHLKNTPKLCSSPACCGNKREIEGPPIQELRSM